MFYYFKNLYDEMKNYKRKDNIKIFVMICIVIYLLNLEIEFKFEDIMLLFEDLINKECRRKLDWVWKFGLMVDSLVDGKIYICLIVRRFCDGYN